MTEQLLPALFWSLAAVPALTVVGYPALMAGRALLLPTLPTAEFRAGGFPAVSMVISAYNEEAVIAEKIENALAQRYPGALEILVATDGSTDRTNAIVRRFAARRVRLVKSPRNEGKSAALNRAVAAARNGILVFSDANSEYHPDAVRHLVARFADPQVGCACGRLVYREKKRSPAERGEILYWNFDALLKAWESRRGDLVAGNGSIIAMRREAIVEIPASISNDFIWPIGARWQGFRAVFEPSAVAYEHAAGTASKEFRRKARIMQRGLNVHHFAWTQLPQVARQRAGLGDRAWLWMQLLLKKLLRYAAFPAVLLMMIVALFLPVGPTFVVGFSMWIALAVAVFFTALHPIVRFRLPAWPTFSYPLAMVLASFAAWVGFFTGRNVSCWGKERTDLGEKFEGAAGLQTRTDP